MTQDFEQQLEFHNNDEEPLRLILEPWAEEWWIDSGHRIKLTGRGPKLNARFDVWYKHSLIIVGAWSGSVVEVFLDGRPITTGSQGLPSL
jgi:hypothetical protein